MVKLNDAVAEKIFYKSPLAGPVFYDEALYQLICQNDKGSKGKGQALLLVKNNLHYKNYIINLSECR
jgi:hypothetical protein